MQTLTAEVDYQPRPEQMVIHREMAKRRYSILVCHRRFGKTVLAVNALIHAALRFRKGSLVIPGQFAYVAPFFRQARDVSWDYFLEFTRDIPGMKYNESRLEITFPNESKITLYGADNADIMRGLLFDGVVLDEVADMKPGVWHKIIYFCLQDRRGWALFIGTPKGINLFSELYYRAVKDPDWYAGMFPAEETSVFTPDELKEMRATKSENEWAQEMGCDFAASVDNILISLASVQQASGKHLRPDEYEHAPKILGIDVARYGGDRSVLFPRQGLVAFKPKVYRSVNNMELAAIAADAIARWEPDAVFVDAGRGEGVIDRLRQLNLNPIEVNFGGRASNPHYVNKRAEMWDAMRRWIDAGGCIPDNPELKVDLCAPTYSYANAANKFELESKDDMKKRDLKSPDLADALALTFAAPVAKKGEMGFKSKTVKAARRHNPHDRLRRTA